MRNKTSQWFECKVTLDKIQENGTTKSVTEQYVVESLSYTEAEARIVEEIKCYTSESFVVKDIKKAQYKEVFLEDKDCSDIRCYKAKLDFITLDEKTQKEKRIRVTYLVQATNIRSAMKNLDEVMRGTMIDYETCALAETKTIDIFEYADENVERGE